MTTLHEAAQKAIYWLDQNGGAHIADELREALAQQGEQQPVAWLWCKDGKPVNVFLQRGDAEDRYWVDRGYTSVPLYAGAAPEAQPDTWTDDGGWTFP